MDWLYSTAAEVRYSRDKVKYCQQFSGYYAQVKQVSITLYPEKNNT